MKASDYCIYVRYSDFHSFNSKLIVATSKAVPSKKIKMLPRIELSTAHILAKMGCVIKSKLYKFEIENIYFWSDSKIVAPVKFTIGLQKF